MQEDQSTLIEDEQPSDKSGDELVQRAFRAREQGDFLRARDLLLEALEHQLDGYSLSELYTILGICYRNLSQFKEALGAYRTALRLDPRSYRAWNSAGVALAEWGKIDEAIRAYRIAIQVNPTYVFAYSNLGDALLAKKRVREAIQVLERAAAMDAAICPPVHSSLALALALAGEFEEAREALQYAIAFDAEDWQLTRSKVEALEYLEYEQCRVSEHDALQSKPLDRIRNWFSGRNKKIEGDDIPF